MTKMKMLLVLVCFVSTSACLAPELSGSDASDSATTDSCEALFDLWQTSIGQVMAIYQGCDEDADCVQVNDTGLHCGDNSLGFGSCPRTINKNQTTQFAADLAQKAEEFCASSEQSCLVSPMCVELQDRCIEHKCR